MTTFWYCSCRHPNTRVTYAEDAEALEEQLKHARQIAPPASDEEVRMFLGWLSADIPELRNVEISKLANSWERFKRRMGVRPYTWQRM